MDTRQGDGAAVAEAIAAAAATAAAQVQTEHPVGYRFVPTDEELVMHYLRNKVLENPIPTEFIKDITFSEFFQKPPNCLVPCNSPERDWYFFIRSGEGFDQYSNEIQIVGDEEGFWKFKGDSYPIQSTNGEVVASKKDLVYFKGHPTKPKRTHWAMELYQLPMECCNNLKVDQQWVEKWSLVKIRRGKSYEGLQ